MPGRSRPQMNSASDSGQSQEKAPSSGDLSKESKELEPIETKIINEVEVNQELMSADVV